MKTLILAVLINMAVLTGDRADIQLKADPKVAFFGVPVMVHATIKPHPELRAARIEYPFGSSTWQIDPRKNNGVERRSFVFKLREPGDHEIILTVYDSMGEVMGRKTVTVKRIEPDQP